MAVPQCGSCASSVRAWRLWTARHSWEEVAPLSAPPLLLGLELATSKVADSTAFEHAAPPILTLTLTLTLTPTLTPNPTPNQVDESDVALAVLRLVELEKLVVEGGGAAGLAAILPGGPLDRPDLKGKKVRVPQP